MGLVFVTRAGRPWAPCNLMRYKLHPLLDSLGIKRCGLHAFRHTNGSLMDRLNAPMKVRQERLGHALGSDITMAIYTHSVGEDDRRVALQLGDCAQLRPTLAAKETTKKSKRTRFNDLHAQGKGTKLHARK